MIDYNSGFSAHSRYNNKYYPLNSIPETQFLIETELRETSAGNADISTPSVKSVMFALGVTVTLIVGTTWHLYSSLKTNPINSQATGQTELSRTLSSSKSIK